MVLPDFRAAFRDLNLAARQGVTGGIRAGAEGLKGEVRQAIEAAGLGSRLGQTIGARYWPADGHASLKAAAEVSPRTSAAAAILDGFVNGAVIRAGNGRRLIAVPTKAAGKGDRGKHLSPADWQARHGQRLRYVQLAGRTAFAGAAVAMLVVDEWRNRRKAKAVAIFWLVDQVTITKRLDFAGLAAKWADALPDLIERATPK